MVLWALIWAIVVLIAIRTVNFGRWVGRNGNKGGAVGLYILALLTVLAPIVVYTVHNMR